MAKIIFNISFIFSLIFFSFFLILRSFLQSREERNEFSRITEIFLAQEEASSFRRLSKFFFFSFFSFFLLTIIVISFGFQEIPNLSSKFESPLSALIACFSAYLALLFGYTVLTYSNSK